MTYLHGGGSENALGNNGIGGVYRGFGVDKNTHHHQIFGTTMKLKNKVLNVSGEYNCVACNHIWKPRKKDGLPAQCPKCDTPYWRNSPPPQEKREFMCLRCDWKWVTRKKDVSTVPARCPHCSSPAWNKPRRIRGIPVTRPQPISA